MRCSSIFSYFLLLPRPHHAKPACRSRRSGPLIFQGFISCKIRSYSCCKRLAVCAVSGINKPLEKSRHSGILFYNHPERMKFSNSPSSMQCVNQKNPSKGGKYFWANTTTGGRVSLVCNSSTYWKKKFPCFPMNRLLQITEKYIYFILFISGAAEIKVSEREV